jgi:hypothetical protein
VETDLPQLAAAAAVEQEPWGQMAPLASVVRAVLASRNPSQDRAFTMVAAAVVPQTPELAAPEETVAAVLVKHQQTARQAQLTWVAVAGHHQARDLVALAARAS